MWSFTIYDPLPEFEFARRHFLEGVPVCLVTLVGVSGGTLRSVGAHMVVTVDGVYSGSMSGGCIEKAVVGEAQKTIAKNVQHEVVYGQGSPYIDIRLPCGGSITLHFLPISDVRVFEKAISYINRRQPFTLKLSRQFSSIDVRACDECSTVSSLPDAYVITHLPKARIEAFGSGAALLKLGQFAKQYGLDVGLWTPDRDELEVLRREHLGTAHLLKSITMTKFPDMDRWTACALLFHDHDWEKNFLIDALETDAFYIGAMGSKKTHATRLNQLRGSGLSENRLRRIHSPIGLFPRCREPETLALSVLAQIVSCYEKSFQPA